MNYDIGDIVEYRTFGGGTRRVRVQNREGDIKNGLPGFDGVVVGGAEDGEEVWGYDDQIVFVLKGQ